MNRLIDLREDRDLSQKQIGDILGISQRKYSHIETGETDLKTEVLEKLADFYEVSTDYLLYRTDVRKPYPKSNICNDDKK